MKRLSKEQVLMLHAQLIDEFGGSDGVRDYKLLDSALENPFQSFGGEESYPTIQAKEVLAIEDGSHEYEDLLKWVLVHQV